MPPWCARGNPSKLAASEDNRPMVLSLSAALARCYIAFDKRGGMAMIAVVILIDCAVPAAAALGDSLSVSARFVWQ